MYVATLVVMFSLSGCNDRLPSSGSDSPEPAKLFDFSTSKNCSVNIDYGTPGYQVLFELYAETPIQTSADGQTIKRDDIEPLYRGSTNSKGTFVDDISIPCFVSEIYLYSKSIGIISPVKLTITNGAITFNQAKYIAENSPAQVVSKSFDYPYPEGVSIAWFLIQGGYDNKGVTRKLPPPPFVVDYFV